MSRRSLNFNDMDDEPTTPTFSVTDMNNTILDLQRRLQEQEKTITETRNELQSTRNQLHASQQELRSTVNTVQTPTPSPEPLSTFITPTPTTENVPIIGSFTKIKVNPPQEFTGSREQTTTFVSQCRLVFRANPGWSDDQKIVYMCSFLRKTAFKWYANQEKAKTLPTTIDGLISTIVDTFGESDLAEKSRFELERLRQTKSCAIYTSEFNRLVTDIGYTDPVALIDIYKKGLKDNVKDLMLSLPVRTTLREVQKDAITCDIRLFQRMQEQKNSTRIALPRIPQPSQSDATSSGPTPMEIDVIQTKKSGLSDAEKKRRKDLNLCLYDGKPDCPGRDNINLCPSVQKKSGNGKRSANRTDQK